jgi:hypothetical protein
MAPNIAKSTLELIYDITSRGELTASQVAEAAACSKRAILASLGTYFETAKRLYHCTFYCARVLARGCALTVLTAPTALLAQEARREEGD